MKTLLVALTLLVSVSAHAVGYDYPVGHLESLMGANSTAMVGSPLGVVFNPSILATLENPSFSVSGSSYIITKAETGTTKFSSLTSVPNAVVSTWKFEKGTLAAALIVPRSRDAEFSSQVPASLIYGAGFPENADVKYSLLSARNLAGAGWGQKLGPCGEDCEVLVGASVFLSYDSIRRNIFISYAPTTVAAGAAQQISANASTTSLLPVLGATWRKGANTALGVRVELPSVLLKTDVGGEAFSHAYVNNNPNGPEYAVARTSAADLVPSLDQWFLSVGGWWRLQEKWTLVANADLGERPRPLSQGDAGESTVEVAGGARYELNEKYAVHAGTRFDTSTLIGKNADTDFRYLGIILSGGLSWITKDLESALGFFNYSSVVSSKPDASKLQPGTLDPTAVQYYGLTLSAQYRF